MSEAYWLDGGPYAPNDLLDRAHVRSGWLEELHQLGTGHLGTWPECNAAVMEWQAAAPLGQTLLHMLANSLVCGERSLILAADEDASALLVSPKGVGRYNLAPRAQLGAFFSRAAQSDSNEWLAQIATSLEQQELLPNELAVVVSSAPQQELPPPFPIAAWLPRSGGVLSSMFTLIAWLEEHKASAGLLLDLPTTGLWQASWVKRL